MPRPQTPPTDPATDRKRRGAWATPDDLVDLVVERTLSGWTPPGRVRVVDPACGDGRFLAAVHDRLRERGASRVELVGVDVDPAAVDAARRRLGGRDASIEHDDALRRRWQPGAFDVVIGNPPFLSQLASATTRGGASHHGGGPYADAAAEFLALAVDVARPGGRIGLVLPQSILAARDAGAVRAAVERRTRRVSSWWSPDRHFDAEVHVCAIVLERAAGPAVTDSSGSSSGSSAGTSESTTTDMSVGRRSGSHPVWTDVVTDALGVPALPTLCSDGVLGDRVTANANFRDEYYGLVPAVVEADAADGAGPPLVTSGLIDPATCHWGRRPVRFAKRRFTAPCVDVDRLDARMRRWAARKLVPKVLVATQTAIVEAVADRDGRWLPGVPVTTLTPRETLAARALGDDAVVAVAAVLTSPTASAWAWHQAAGTGLSSRTLRVGPGLLAAMPWPAGDLAPAVAALHAGDVVACGAAVDAAYRDSGTNGDTPWVAMADWWAGALGRVMRATRRDTAGQ